MNQSSPLVSPSTEFDSVDLERQMKFVDQRENNHVVFVDQNNNLFYSLENQPTSRCNNNVKYCICSLFLVIGMLTGFYYVMKAI